MNWLAHALLAEPNRESRLGNVLADLVKGKDRERLGRDFLRGVRHHHWIDSFTDSHPIVHRSQSHLVAQHHLLSGVLVDIFYDHFLAVDWHEHHPQPLAVFTADLYADLDAVTPQLPAEIQPVVQALVVEDWFGSYRHLDGIEDVLRRMSRRISARLARTVRLDTAMVELHSHYAELRADFAAFFPLIRHGIVEAHADDYHH